MLFHTPWGTPHRQEIVAPGITRLTTAGHGGYHVEATAMAAMPPELAAFPTWAGDDARGGKWYEEDEDWCVVPIAFPHAFPPYKVWTALQAFLGAAERCERFADAALKFVGPARAAAEAAAAEWYDAHRHLWRLRHRTHLTLGEVAATYIHMTTADEVTRLVGISLFESLPEFVEVLPGTRIG